MLTSALPLDPDGAELATVVIVAGLAAIGAVEPALRRRAAALPLVAPLVATVLGCAMSAGGGAPAAWLAPAFAFGAAVLLALARYAPADTVGRPAERTRRAVAALLGCAMLAVVAAAGWYGPALLTRTGQDTPADARNLLPQPVRPREGASPLVLYPALLRGERTLSLTVHAEVPPSLLRYVSLDRFDGEHWNTSARYRRTGGRLPAGEPARQPVTHRTETVDINNPRDPGCGRPRPLVNGASIVTPVGAGPVQRTTSASHGSTCSTCSGMP